MKVNCLKKTLILLITLSGLFACSFNVDQGGTAGSKEQLVISVTNVGETTAELAWNTLADAKGYAVFYKSEPKGDYILAGVELKGFKKGTVPFLVPANRYSFLLKEIVHIDLEKPDSIVYGRSSNVVGATTKAASLPTPVVKETTSTANSVTIKYSEVPGTTHYLIYRADSNSNFINYDYSFTTTYVDNSQSLEPGATYTYRVMAFSSSTIGGSLQTPDISVTLKTISK